MSALAVQQGAAPQQPGRVGVRDATSPLQSAEYEGELTLLPGHCQTPLSSPLLPPLLPHLLPPQQLRPPPQVDLSGLDRGPVLVKLGVHSQGLLGNVHPGRVRSVIMCQSVGATAATLCSVPCCDRTDCTVLQALPASQVETQSLNTDYLYLQSK